MVFRAVFVRTLLVQTGSPERTLLIQIDLLGRT